MPTNHGLGREVALANRPSCREGADGRGREEGALRDKTVVVATGVRCGRRRERGRRRFLIHPFLNHRRGFTLEISAFSPREGLFSFFKMEGAWRGSGPHAWRTRLGLLLRPLACRLACRVRHCLL